MGNGQSLSNVKLTKDAINSAWVESNLPRDFLQYACDTITENTAKGINTNKVYMFCLRNIETREVMRKLYVKLNEQGVPLIQVEDFEKK